MIILEKGIISKAMNFFRDFGCLFNPLLTRNTYKGTLANSEDPDKMPHNVEFHKGYAAFYQGQLCMLRRNRSFEKEIQNILEIITCDPSIYT